MRTTKEKIEVAFEAIKMTKEEIPEAIIEIIIPNVPKDDLLEVASKAKVAGIGKETRIETRIDVADSCWIVLRSEVIS